MAAETAILVKIAASLASGILKKAVGAASESSTAAGLKSAIFGGLEDNLRLLEKELCRLDSVLACAQRIDPTQQDNNALVLIWLRDVKQAASNADNLLDEIAYEKVRRKMRVETSAAAKLLARSDTSFAFRLRIAGEIKKCVSMIAKIYQEAETTLNLAKIAGIASTSSNQPPPATIAGSLTEIRQNPAAPTVLGRENDEWLVRNKLCSTYNDQILNVVAIVGRSGVGKTTLARMIYDSKTVQEHFGRKTWIFVSDNFGLKRFLDEMLQSVTGQSHKFSNISAMEDKLQQSLEKEKNDYLLVLDDVWNTDEQLWRSVQSVLIRVTRSIRCSVLVTTQSSHVASLMGASTAHQLEGLSDTNAWTLFKKLAFANKTEEQLSTLEDVGRRILKKCGGLPLAINSLGSLLGHMDLESQWTSIEESEIWSSSLNQSNIMPWLLISFHHLRDESIKQCFVFCSIFIQKGESVQKSDLIAAWMAQGYIQSTRGSALSMEDTGEAYVSNLVANGLLQVSYKVELWMHDLVHDMARFISKGTCWNIPREASELQAASEAEHLLISGESHSESKYSLPKGKAMTNLRTLICTKAVLSVDFATQAKILRDLRLIDCGLKEVPSSIGSLKHLRYLSLCDNPFQYLPDSIGALFNLQTLNLEKCFMLKELPQGVTKLVNLRHILTSRGEMKMPRGIGQLTNLRTLPPIGLGEKKGFDMKEFKSMESLSGDIEISGLHLISCKEDVAEACGLKTKEGIRKLSLSWQRYRGRVANIDEEILDALHPHSNLKEITVKGFGGKRLSSWLLEMNKLKTIVLHDCDHCEQLPALGQLASLEKIEISRMKSLEVIGVEFYCTDAGRATGTLFPRLTHLSLWYMEKLRDWVQPPTLEHAVFPSCKNLEIRDCPLLVSAPTCFYSLTHLSIDKIRSVEAVRMILTNTHHRSFFYIKVKGIEDLTSISQLQLRRRYFRTTLDVADCKELSELYPTSPTIEDMEGLLSLEGLGIVNCPKIGTAHGLESCVSISNLKLRGNGELKLIPDLRKLSRLTTLEIVDFSQQMSIPEWLSSLPSLEYLEIGRFNEELEQLDGAAHLPESLTSLKLYGWPMLTCLPSELQRLNQLTMLEISNFDGIESLGEWLGGLTSLLHLSITGCKKLKYLPSPEAMQRLTQLTSFNLGFDCKILMERCKGEGCEEWHKLSHFPHVLLWRL